MQEILEQLNQVAGVKGSMVVTKDGVVVSEALGPDLDTNTVAAVSSHMIQVASRSLGALDRGMFERFTLTKKSSRRCLIALRGARNCAITKRVCGTRTDRSATRR